MHIFAILIPITLSYLSLIIISTRHPIAPVPLAFILLTITFTSLLAIVSHFVAHRILHNVQLSIHSRNFSVNPLTHGWGQDEETGWATWDNDEPNYQPEHIQSVPSPIDWTIT